MDRAAILRTVWRGEAVEDPAFAKQAVEVAGSELRRRRRSRPVAFVAAVLGLVIAITDFAEGTIAPAIVLTLLAIACVVLWWRAPAQIDRLERAERLNAELSREDAGVLAHAPEDL